MKQIQGAKPSTSNSRCIQVTFNKVSQGSPANAQEDKGFWLFSDGKENTRVEDTPRDMYNALMHFDSLGYDIKMLEGEKR